MIHRGRHGDVADSGGGAEMTEHAMNVWCICVVGHFHSKSKFINMGAGEAEPKKFPPNITWMPGRLKPRKLNFSSSQTVAQQLAQMNIK